MFAEHPGVRVGQIDGASEFLLMDFWITLSLKCTEVMCRSFPLSEMSNRTNPRRMSLPDRRSFLAFSMLRRTCAS